MNKPIFLIGLYLFIVAPLAITLFLLCVTIYKRALDTTRSKGALAFLLCLATAAVSVVYRQARREHFYINEQSIDPVFTLIAAGLLPFFAIPFILNLYRRWIGGRISEAEKAPGMDGIRAWLSSGSVICAFFIATLACLGYGYSFWGLLALTVMALLAYPALNLATTSFQPPVPKTEDLSPERERVLRMLDEGKITADESAELLNALGQSGRPASMPVSSAADPNRKMILTGLVLLLIGFFLPWFSFDLGDEVARVFSGMQQQVNEISRQNPGVTIRMPSTGALRITGGEIQYGLGWFVLLLGIAAAAIPYVANHLHSDAQHKAKLIILGIGSLILIYLLTQNLRFVSVGILLGLAGYALQWVGTLKERQDRQTVAR